MVDGIRERIDTHYQRAVTVLNKLSKSTLERMIVLQNVSKAYRLQGYEEQAKEVDRLIIEGENAFEEMGEVLASIITDIGELEAQNIAELEKLGKEIENLK